MELDIISRQGAETFISKLVKLGAESVQQRVEGYLAGGQVWAEQLEQIVGDEAWARLAPRQQLDLALLRGELLFFGNTPDPLAPLGKGCGRFEMSRWNLTHMTSRGFVHDKLLSVLENRRDHRERQMCSVQVSVPSYPIPPSPLLPLLLLDSPRSHERGCTA